jgi:hypothetical protein
MDLLVNIDVDDLSKAIAFCQQAAGLRLGRRFGSLGVENAGHLMSHRSSHGM